MANSARDFSRELQNAIKDAKKSALTKGATLLYIETHHALDRGSPGGGREYKRGRRTHRASVRGAAPARDYGELARAIGMQVYPDLEQAVVGVKNNVRYGKYLDPVQGREPRIGRRPFLTEAVRNSRQDVVKAIEDELERKLRRFGR